MGRTGAGKSTLLAALFRMIEPQVGTVEIDSVDVSQLGLHDLRRVISMIPQTPQLFVGTLRFNLDPTDQHSDQEVWEAIRKVIEHGFTQA